MANSYMCKIVSNSKNFLIKILKVYKNLHERSRKKIITITNGHYSFVLKSFLDIRMQIQYTSFTNSSWL